MIELIENKLIKNPKNSFQLLVNGEIIEAKVRNFKRDEKTFININISDLRVAKKISEYKFKHFPNLYYLTMPLKIEGSEYLERIYITHNHVTGQFELKFRYKFDVKIWKKRSEYLHFYSSYLQFVTELNYGNSKFAKDFKGINLKPQLKSLSHKDLAFELSFTVLDFHETFSNEINGYSNILDSYYKAVLKLQLSRAYQKNNQDDNTIKNAFIFPEKLKTPCEQYLLYFAQFLQDLGINATSDLKEKAGKVLFSVTPTDDVEALDKIREALAVYLKLPESPIVYDDSFAAIRLKYQIDSLKHSQQMAETEFRLKMAQSLAEAQNKTITDQSEIIVNQATFIQQQKEHIEKINNPAVIMNSAENKEELEEICEGLKIGKSKFLKEQLGIDFNPATFAKGIGNKILGKQETTSIIETDEENK